MNFAFFGNAEFSAIVLRKLLDAGLIPAAIVCAPDKPLGRKQILTPSPVKQLIEKEPASLRDNLEIFQPGTKEELLAAADELSSLHPDFFVVAAYPRIIPESILRIPRLGTIGVHPSLLPRHRGASPIQTSVLEGDSTAGTSLFLMDEKVDHGPLITQQSLKNYDPNLATYEKLQKELAELSGDLLVQNIPPFFNQETKPQAQNESQATYTKKFSSDDGYVSGEDLESAQNSGGAAAREIDRKIRALNPEPGVWTMQNGSRIKLLDAKIIDGKLKLLKIQKEGKTPIQLPD